MNLIDAVASLEKFVGSDLTRSLASTEFKLQGLTGSTVTEITAASGVNEQTLAAAGQIKRVAGQINVVIHALGILHSLPHILEPGERIEYVSLGAGNTGRPFDLETNLRVAEFKFISWRGGPESIRQNGLFKDFFMLAESGVNKRKYLYVLGTDHPLKFFNGGRALASILSRNEKTRELFEALYGTKYAVVREYFSFKRDAVIIEDVSKYLGPLYSPSVDWEDGGDGEG